MLYSLPTVAALLIALAVKMLAGLKKYAVDLGITQIIPVNFQAELDAFVAADGDFNSARSATQVASDAFKAADTAVAEWLQAARNMLTTHFGNRWSTMWAQAGFVNHSTAIPKRIEDRLGLCLNLANFLTANPTYEVAPLNITAARATLLRTAALDAQQAGITAGTTQRSAGDTRASAQATLETTMRMLISILKAVLGRNDPRWNAFGLDMPSMNTTPGQPVGVKVQLDETGALITQCDPTPLATRYRWRMLIVGVEPAYRLVASTIDPIGMIKNALLPGETARIIVQAVNGDRQGVASEPVEFTLPAAAMAKKPETAPVPEPAVLEEVTAPANGNGSNGHANGTRVPALA